MSNGGGNVKRAVRQAFTTPSITLFRALKESPKLPMSQPMALFTHSSSGISGISSCSSHHPYCPLLRRLRFARGRLRRRSSRRPLQRALCWWSTRL